MDPGSCRPAPPIEGVLEGKTAYVAALARHSRLSSRGLAAAVVLVVVGFAAVWLAVFGPVLALTCSLAAFAVIWVSDRPQGRPRTEDRFVRIEELQRDDDGS